MLSTSILLPAVLLAAVSVTTAHASTPNQASSSSKTSITHSLQFTLTNESCDSVLSPSQCFGVLVDGDSRPTFSSISGEQWQEAISQIDSVINPLVSIAQEPARWKAIRGLAIQSRQLINRYNDAREDNQVPERRPPQSLLDLAKIGISKVEIAHRFLISGDRLLVEHTLFDRSNPADSSLAMATTRPRELATNITASLGMSISESMSTLADDAVKKVNEKQ